MGRRWEDFVKALFTKILPVIGFLLFVAGSLNFLFFEKSISELESGLGEAMRNLSLMLTILLVAFVAFACYNLAISKDIRDILDERLPKKIGNPGNPTNKEGEEKEEEIRTSGAGALVGMVGGALIGLPFGPAGVVIGGLLGAIIGNQIEYEQEREKREKRR